MACLTTCPFRSSTILFFFEFFSIQVYKFFIYNGIQLGGHGAALSNIIFAAATASVIEFATIPVQNRCFAYIAMALGKSVYHYCMFGSISCINIPDAHSLPFLFILVAFFFVKNRFSMYWHSFAFSFQTEVIMKYK
jgi:hypothetical protein